LTPSGIEPATIWLVAQFLNQLRYRVPLSRKVVVKIIESKENLSAVHILCKTNVMNVYSMALCFISRVETDKII
jgi:hypothetical protein